MSRILQCVENGHSEYYIQRSHSKPLWAPVSGGCVLPWCPVQCVLISGQINWLIDWLIVTNASEPGGSSIEPAVVKSSPSYLVSWYVISDENLRLHVEVAELLISSLAFPPLFTPFPAPNQHLSSLFPPLAKRRLLPLGEVKFR